MSSRTRKEAQQERRRREAEEKRRQQYPQQNLQASTSGYLGPTDEHGIIESATNLRYNIHGLSNPVKLTAQRGLAADNISVERVKTHMSMTHDPYIGLQIVERLRLCIYNLPKDGRKLECSCAEFTINKPKICSHIYWLYDRINSVQQPSDTFLPRLVSVHDVETTLTQILNRSNTEIENLPEKISPLWTESDEEADREIEDMLAVLDPKRLSGEYDEDFYTSLPSSNTHRFCDLVIPGNLFKTIFALTRHDHNLKARLSLAITREASDKDFLRKLSKHRRSCFEQLSQYEKEGPEFRPNQIAQSYWSLHEIIGRLSEYRQRVYEVPNQVFDRACAKQAIKILRTICDWNRDIYTNTTWLQEENPPASPKDCNLYLYFTVTSIHNQDSNDPNFLAHFLCTELPTEASSTHQQDLVHLTSRLTDFNAPASLLQPLLDLLQTLQSIPAPPLAELDNYQSLSISSPRSRTGSSSSGSSYASTDSRIAPSSSNIRRPSSALESPSAQRRRLY